MMGNATATMRFRLTAKERAKGKAKVVLERFMLFANEIGENNSRDQAKILPAELRCGTQRESPTILVAVMQFLS
jgi:hypothetical protein